MEILEHMQGKRPEMLTIILGNKEKVWLRTQDYNAYFYLIKSSLFLFKTNGQTNQLPDPAESKTHGRWSQYAKNILEKWRHLSLIANITRSQIKRLERAGITTIDEAAELSFQSIPRLSDDVLGRIKSQAKLQISSENLERPNYQILPHNADRSIGLALLPPHSDNDIFFDIEGFPFVEGGLEYLGVCYFSNAGEKNLKISGT